MAGFNFQSAVGYTIALLLIAALTYRLVATVRTTFGRPGPDIRAVTAHSVSVGRGLLLLGLVLAVVLGRWLTTRTDSSAFGVGTLGIVGLLCAMATETRWPRQSGAIRVAQLGGQPYRSMLPARYVVGSAFAIASTALAASFFLPVDSAVGALPRTVTTTAYIDPSGATVLTDCPGCVVSPGTFITNRVVSVDSVWLDCGLLALALLLGVGALWQIRRRRSLAGVTAETDRTLRRVSAQRVIRIVIATFLGTVAVWASDLGGALQSPVPSPTPLALELSGFLVGVSVLSGLGILFLYLVGPTERSLRRAVGLPTPTTK